MVAYNDGTKVTGAQTGIAGLANQPNTKVTVKFTARVSPASPRRSSVEKDKP